MRWAWHIARMWEKTVGGQHERKSPLGKTRRRWENNIKINIYTYIYIEICRITNYLSMYAYYYYLIQYIYN
jgi:hypothetical protein